MLNKELRVNIIFFGASQFVLPILDVLKANYNLSLVLTTEKEISDAVPSWCMENEVKYVSIIKIDQNIVQKIVCEKPEFAILAYFRLILPKKLLSIFPEGIINIHPSLLPKYRGPTPVQTAIKNGDKTTGVTIIKLDEEVDHGAIFTQTEEPILADDTANSLHRKLFLKGAELLVENINKYLNKTLKPKEQNHENATYTQRLTRENGYIDINNPPAKKNLDRLVRAYYPWPGVWTRQIINGKSSIIKFLPRQKVQVEGKKPVSIKDFLNGYPEISEKMEKIF